MRAAATTTFDVPAPPTQVLAAVRRVIADGKHRPVAETPAGDRVDFVTRKTMLSWELEAQVAIAETEKGSRVTVTAGTAAGRPAALLDGKKNQKSVGKLADQVRAALG
jgi:hypothetical protein